MWTCALVSSAISAAFSPPHVPARSLGGLTPVGSHGPIASVTAATANNLSHIASPDGVSLPIYPPETSLRHYDPTRPPLPCLSQPSRRRRPAAAPRERPTQRL